MINMYLNKLIGWVTTNDEIVNKSEIIEYISTKLVKKLYIWGLEDVYEIEQIIKEYNYDINKFDKLLTCGMKFKNAVLKNGKYPTRPQIGYILATKKLFDSLDIDIEQYNTKYLPANVAISKAVYSISTDNGFINNEANFIELVKKIVNTYSIGKGEKSEFAKVLNIVNRVNKALREMETKYNGVVTSEEFLSLFKFTDKICALPFSEIIKEFYPTYKNKLFTYITDYLDDKKYINSDDLVKYLREIKVTHIALENCKEDIKNKITTVDIGVKQRIEKAFLSLTDSVKNSHNIKNELKDKILESIDYEFTQYKLKQEEFIDEKAELFFNNCLEYINLMSKVNNNTNVNLNNFIATFLDESKDFFTEYDAKTFKDIANFIIENTDLDADNIKRLGNTCKIVFKNGSVEKLKSIRDSLNEFKDFINDKFDDKKLKDNFFELLVLNNPEYLLLDNNIKEIIDILKGNINLKMYGYSGDDIALNKDFLSYDFYDRIIKDDFNLLFNGGVKVLNSNLSYVYEVCEKCGIDMKNLNISDNFLYTLLNDHLYDYLGADVSLLKGFFNSDQIQNLVEKNPELLKIENPDIEIMFKRCLLNSNSTYNFYDLFVSELYTYKHSYFIDTKEAMKDPFTYYDLDIDTSKLNFDVEDVLTSGILKDSNIKEILEKYNDRNSKIRKLNERINSLKNMSFIRYSEVSDILGIYRELYGLVPDTQVKNNLFDVIDTKKDSLGQSAADIEESILEKQNQIEAYKLELQDGMVIQEQLYSVLGKLNSDTAKNELQDVINNNKSQRIIATSKKISKTNNDLEDLHKELRRLDNDVDTLNSAVCQIDSLDDAIYGEYINKNSFCLNDAIVKEEPSNKELILDSNVVVFANSIDLDNKEFLDDKDCKEKLYKFLVDPKFCLKSIEYMRANWNNAEFIEKYRDHRDKIRSRRESRTPLRVYFIPIKTKYFTMYYVANVEKENVHYHAGMSDGAYKSHVLETEKIAKMIDKMTMQEVIEYVEKMDKEYKDKIKPLIRKRGRK